ncbi:MAG TPA: hypothetical protein VIC08_10880, partial [Cellvibrionaceae bacterium]
RSVFDIFYLGRRDRRRVLNLVRADVLSILETSTALRQEEFFVALKNIDKVGVDFVDKLFITASVRAKDTDTKLIDQMSDLLVRLDPALQQEIVSVYRLLITCRLLSERVFTCYEQERYEDAVSVVCHLTPLILRLKKNAKKMLRV